MNDWVTEQISFDAGQELFKEGHPPQDAYLIKKGRVEITKSIDGRTVVVGYRNEGDVVGEMALIDKSPRSATATATEPTVCIVITEKLFNEHMSRVTPLLRQVLMTFTANLRDMGNQFARTRT